MELILTNVQKKLDGRIILPNVNITIPGGKVIGLLGPNGSGKTTLLKLISGLTRPNKGMLELNGVPYSYPETSWQINYLSDSLIFPQNYKVLDAISFYQENFIDFSTEKVHHILEDLAIDTTQTFSQMSKGQQERVTLALVLSRQSQLTLLDEPLAAVDVTTRDEILKMIHNYLDKTSSVIITTHLIFDMQDFFDEVIFIQNGEIPFYQPMSYIKENYQQDLLTIYRQFFGTGGMM